MLSLFKIGTRKFKKIVLFFIVCFGLWVLWFFEHALLIDRTNKIRTFYDDKIARRPYNVNFESILAKEEAEIDPNLGYLGKPAYLTEKEAEADAVFKVEAFNLLLSNKIPYNRTLPDSRDPRCLNKIYPQNLPSASVIIIFTNERWSSLIRTIHSVLLQSPEQYLAEIILVDDNSSHEELKDKLDYYIDTRLPSKVRLYRLKQRSGLIRARLFGAKQAIGEVLVFLDAHCEATKGWLEPLLVRIKQNRKAVVVPIIDVIDDKTLEYQNNGGNLDFEVGGFTWSGHFTWIPISDEEKARRGSPEAPTRSPTMAGGLFAMDTKYFWELGSYDELMDVWGGENLEMSFRIWQCGGILETVPCSRVGHIFRSFHPYNFPNNKDTHGINTARLVKVWMDDYQRLFFLHRPDLKEIDIGDIQKRLKLKKDLGCKSFSWYLKNIYVSKFIPDENVFHWGQVGTAVNNMCLDNLQGSEEGKSTVGMYPCNAHLTISQYFSLSFEFELRREFVCVESLPEKSIGADKCDGSQKQKWIYNSKKQLMREGTNLCLDTELNHSSTEVKVLACDDKKQTQIWTWYNKLET